MFLDSTLRKIQVVLAGAVTTNELPIVVDYVDFTSTATTPGASQTITTGASAVDAVAAPAASTQRQVKLLTVQNADTVNATVTVIFNDNGTSRTMFKAILASGDMLVYDVAGFKVFNSGGSIKSVATSSVTAHEATHVSGSTDPFLSTDLLEAIVKRLQTSTGPTTLTLGAITDGQYLKRSGTTIIGGEIEAGEMATAMLLAAMSF